MPVAERPNVPQPRPKWAEAIRMFVTDTVIDDDYDYPEDGSEDGLHDQVERAVLDTMCSIWGHDIVDDQCMIPEHRYCVYCGRRATDVVPSL